LSDPARYAESADKEISEMPTPTRRDFLKTAAAASAASTLVVPAVFGQAPPREQPAERTVVAMMGVSSRGTQLGSTFASLPGVFIKYAADVDEGIAAAGARAIGKKAAAANKAPEPQPVKDFRKVLDDPDVQALIIAAPDHWHAPAAILAASAGKHVYVEKPCCHNPHEGELLLAAQQKYKVVMQQGSQRRSYPKLIEAIQKLKEGVIGKVTMSRGWYTNNRPPIGKGKVVPVPGKFDWTMWQGPAPDREYHDNYHPYNWHWFWHWGTGEAGNNGIHSLDICRWGLGVDCPTKVTSAGGRYHYHDDWETPDTQFATFDYGDKVIHWEGRSCHPRGVENNTGFGIAFYGDKGSLIIDAGNGYTIYDLKNKQVDKQSDKISDAVHTQNFIDGVRAKDGSKLYAPIHEAVPSTLLCHLANIAQRVGRTLHLDATAKKIINDPDAAKLWSREYRPGWEPKV
jgi:predicted dehydrogenase